MRQYLDVKQAVREIDIDIRLACDDLGIPRNAIFEMQAGDLHCFRRGGCDARIR
ncbi:hypothetical protein [Cucumibacter marinus]|uniref:hypothetical protein n=1 Tax=Cucumibacter marinus TaxID=1121252 RepID=UPI0012DDD031|nr:hypothetical protein [Cucumibacter marinus]